MDNINDHYFDGFYQEVWRTIIPTELTSKEVEYMVRQFSLGKSSKVLDLMCGYGRHAIALGQLGIEVVAIDNHKEYTEEISSQARTENLPVSVRQESVQQLNWSGQFNLVICMGNSLNFFDRSDSEKILKKIADSLLPGGHVLINSWSLLETVAKNFRERTWEKVNDIKCINESKFHFNPSRIETDTLMLKGQIQETRKAVDYVYSVAELHEIFSLSGLEIKTIESIPGRKAFQLGDPRAYIVAGRSN